MVGYIHWNDHDESADDAYGRNNARSHLHIHNDDHYSSLLYADQGRKLLTLQQ